jgi:hypothetical protein
MDMPVGPSRASTTPWYRVIEMWLILLLLSSEVVGSFALLGTALRHPDLHLVVPNDVPRSSQLPPLAPAAAGARIEAGQAPTRDAREPRH